MPLFLREADVERLLLMSDALTQVEAVLRDYALGDAQNRPRQRVRPPKGVLHVMAGGWFTRGYMGFKAYAGTRSGTRFFVHLFRADTGEYVAIMEADRLGQMRTGAASGVAARFMARADASRCGILGSGWQAEAQLEAICAVRPIRTVNCYSRDAEHRRAFAEKLGVKLNVDIAPVETAEQAVREMDIVTTITSAATPIVRGEWLAPGTHINAAGSNWATRRELDSASVRRADLVAADSVENAMLEAGDLIQAVQENALGWQEVKELGDVIAGRTAGRTASEQITLFKSCGVAMEDVAVGAWVYERARALGIGVELPF